ncbi:MAG TPA: glutamate-5-semialdehyde dehydrogenase [Polyangiaceae bacterium]|nr:glutamate-5-semialdehyde dehydrogenase [Polyangiaceae bacterium]
MQSPIVELAEGARRAARVLRTLSRGQKDRALECIAARLREQAGAIAEHNARDLESARAAGLSAALLDRLRMDPKITEATARGVEQVRALPDPVGSQSAMERRPNGLLVGRERVPLGVIAMIYESRPNVTVDAAALCLKSGNAVLLRGGKEAASTNAVLGSILGDALVQAGLPREAVQIVPAGDRESVRELLGLNGLIDLVIPRGGEGLVRFVAENARVPVIQHYKGVNHLFLDAGADLEKAKRLAVNGKAQRPSTCNALECLLVHAADAERLLPPVLSALADAGVEIRGCPRTRALVPSVVAASDDDWGREYLDLVIAVRVVADLSEALEHVQRYGSNHTEAICTENYTNARRWQREVDASCVIVNASTRFNDGGELGLGCEIGISTSKLHAYGPMGLESLTTEKWIVLGEGQERA